MSAPAQNIVGIFSAGRDGSSLLMRLVDGSPGLWMYPIEIKFLAQLAPALGRTIPGGALRSWAKYQFGELQRHYVARLEEPFPVPAAPHEALSERVEYEPGDGLMAFLACAANAHGGTAAGALGFKSTEAEQKRLYEQGVPGLRMIHIVRDPVSQFSSTKRTVLERPGFLYWFQRGDFISTFVRRWRVHVETALDGLRRDPARHLLVRYEDLKERPAAEVHRITQWLGIDPPPEPDVQTVFGGRRMKRLPANPSKAGVETPTRVVSDMEKTFGYTDVVSRREERLVRHCTASLGAALGYPVSEPRMTRLARVRLAGAWLLPEKWELALIKRRRRALLELFSRRRFVFHALFSSSSS